MPSAKIFPVVTCLLPVWFRLALGILLLGLFNAPAQTLDETQKLFRQGDYEKVIATVQARTNVTLSIDWRILLLKSLLTVGQYEAAHREAQAALEYAPLDLRLLTLGRETALFQNDPAGANRRLAEMKTIIERRGPSAQNGESLVAFGEALLLLGVEPKLVLENCFRRAERLASPPREAFLATGKLALEKHDFAMAADSFRAGLKKFPDDPELLGGLAQAFESGNRKEMMTALESALEINPRHPASLLLLADHLIDAEQYDEAEKQLALVLGVNPFQPEALAYRAVIAHLKNERAREQQLRAEALKFWPTNPEVDHLIGRKLSQKYRFQEGAASQRRALAYQADYLPARRQLAEDLLRLGQTEEGWELAEAVHRQDEYDVTAYNLTTLRDHMVKFRTLTNADFIVRMSVKEADLYGERVLRLLNRAKASLCDKYGVQLPQPTVVEIFPEQKDFAVRTFGMPDNPGYLGVCFGSVITANSPASQAPNPANWESVLWHEFCHVVTLNATKNRMPRWLSEGISVYEERQANPAWGEQLNLAYREMVLGDDLVPLSKLSGAFLSPETPMHLQFAYYESSMAVEFIIEKFGLEAIKKILRDLRAGEEINKTIAAHTAKLSDVEKDFAAYIKAKAEQLAPDADLEKPPDRGAETEWIVWEKLHPKNYHVQMRKARDLMEAKRWAEAKPILEPLASSYSGESRGDNPLWLLAVTERNLDNTNAELALLEKLATKDADFVDLYSRLLQLSQLRENWTAVTNYAERLLAVNPLIALPHRALARAATVLGKPDEAITAYRALLLLNPPDPVDVHYQLARLLHARGEATAKRHVLQALEEAPRYREAQQLLLEIQAGKSRATAVPN
ncbi:MAG: tetratricopeptide repeat protein [Akkermansiaceae bacterium]|nr:tetratricopeptide repeat protein [Verrucomicrobiales bacterium]